MMTYKDLDRVAQIYGDAFYLLDCGKFSANFVEMRDAFRAYYPKTNIAYSYKTNYSPVLCNMVKKLGGYAEVVSEMEYELARKLGVENKNIYYNGPYKKKNYLKKTLHEHVHVNIDNFQEYEFVREMSAFERVFIGIRCNFDMKNGKKSRFGFDCTNSSFGKMIEEIKTNDNIILEGLHCHFPERALDLFVNRIEGIIDVLERYIDFPLKYISLGGGYFGKIDPEFAKSFTFPVATYDDYARVIAKRMQEYFSDNEPEAPELIIEPGSAVVADTMKYVTRVVAMKNVRGREIAILSGSAYNVNPSTKGMNRPISVFSAEKEKKHCSDWDMVGYTCIEDDVMYHGYDGELGIDDFVVFHNVGSYSVVFKPPFILPNVPVLDVTDNEIKVIKRAENIDDVFLTYTFE